jgi:hypothetical protein
MEHLTTILFPASAQLAADEIVADAAQTGMRSDLETPWSIGRRTFRGGLSDGVTAIDLCNGPLTVTVLPTRGMGIWDAWLGDIRLGWNSPVKEPVHPQHVALNSRNGLGWLDGFGELICRCGLAFNGPPGVDSGARSPIESELTLHGRIANIPANTLGVVCDRAGSGIIGVEGVVDECTMFGPQLRLKSRVTTELGSRSFTIEDEVQNLASTETELELLYHTNIGPPFLGEGAKFIAPVGDVGPRDMRAADGIHHFDTYLGPTPGYSEQAYFFHMRSDEHHRTEVLLQNAAGDLGVSMAYHAGQLPFFTLWKCTQPEQDGYVTGLEPGTNLPNFKSFEREQGRVIRLPAGSHYRTSLTLTIHDSPSRVDEARRRIANLMNGEAPTVHAFPAPPWAPPVADTE